MDPERAPVGSLLNIKSVFPSSSFSSQRGLSSEHSGPSGARAVFADVVSAARVWSSRGGSGLGWPSGPAEACPAT